MKKLPVSEKILDAEKNLTTWEFCAPVFIASAFSGTLLVDEAELIVKEFDERTVRSGTLTFVSYKGECFAITCKHVVDALEEKQRAWKSEHKTTEGVEAEIDGYLLFTPIATNQFHFNYKLTPVPLRPDGTQPDVAIARVKHQSITRLGRKPIVLTKKVSLPETGIASGYPEQQRVIEAGTHISTFKPKFTTCVATMQMTAKGDLLIMDTIDDHKGLDNLSGMSGGPIIWSDGKHFGLAGIVREGKDIQPKKGMMIDESCIWIHGERITVDLFEEWIKSIPPLNEFKDQTKSLYIPESINY